MNPQLQEPRPVSLGWDESEVSGLTDAELAEYVAHWRDQRAEYRRKSGLAGKGRPDVRRWNFSAWKCGTRESIGNRETEFRQVRRQEQSTLPQGPADQK